MFNRAAFPKSLEESVSEDWLETGRASKIGYKYMLIVWDNYDDDSYDLYSESRVA